MVKYITLSDGCDLVKWLQGQPTRETPKDSWKDNEYIHAAYHETVKEAHRDCVDSTLASGMGGHRLRYAIVSVEITHVDATKTYGRIKDVVGFSNVDSGTLTLIGKK